MDGYKLMKKLILYIIAIVFLLTPVLYAGSPHLLVLAKKNAGGATYPEITHFYTFDTVADPFWNAATDCSDGDTTPIINAGENQAVTVIVGTASFKADAATEYLSFSNANNMAKTNKGTIGFWFRYNAWDAYEIIFNGSGSSDGLNIQLRAAGIIRIVYDDGVASGVLDSDNTAVPSADTNYFIEIVYDNTVGDGSDYIKVYVDNVIKIDVTGLTMDTYNMAAVAVGASTADTAVFFWDNLIITDTPAQGGAYQHRNLTAKPAGACNG